MASNHTEHFSLNQWLPDDQVKRTDFNEDNAKIDAALNDLSGGLAEKADQAALDALAAEVAKKATTAALEALSKKLASMPCLVTGTYTGDGAESRLISLGFQPKALLVMREEGYSARPYTDDYYGGLALPGKPVCLQTSYGTDYILTIESKGFRVYYNNSRHTISNQKEANYYYLAWK
ncbi:hypothetical protein [uncultured Intestinimonas sp.]|uniref:hypothetical protein n=1 Tax=uncultured Intestinimonas sp. TaxID=1689265 RepID=UPI00294286BC|nr:hypothetical protein [uncultured Intestinimonas sp.]